jgi:hypothetical protein
LTVLDGKSDGKDLCRSDHNSFTRPVSQSTVATTSAPSH